MVAITVRYHPPTNSRACRYSATATSNNKRVYVSQDDALNVDDNKDLAALQLCKKMNWTGNLVKGETSDGTVYVFVHDHAWVINPEVDRVSSTAAEIEYIRNARATQLGNPARRVSTVKTSEVSNG